MKKSKNIKFIIILVMVIAFFTACANNQNGDQNQNGEENQQGEPQPVEKEPVKTDNYYTANESGSISVISKESNEVVHTIETNGTTHNLQVSPDAKIFGATVSNGMNDNGMAKFYNIENNELINEVEVGKHPAHIEFTRDGKYAIVANSGDNNLSVIDISKYEVVNTVQTGKGPHGLRITSDNKLAFVANMGENSMSVISLINFTQLNKIEIGASPVTTAIAGDNQTIFVTLQDEDALAIYSMRGGEITKVPVGKKPAQVYVLGDYAYVANQGTEASPSNTVSKVNIETQTVEATIEVGNGAHGVVVSNDNQFVYVTNIYDGTVSVIDNNTNKVITNVKVGEEPNGISVK